MSGMGDRMDLDDCLVWNPDGTLKSAGSDPLPDDETLARLKKQGEEYRRRFPPPPGTPSAGPLQYRRRTPEK